MIICINCGQTNRPGAFYCKHCGIAVVCPRCRVILENPGAYCDNCGQALNSAEGVSVIPDLQFQSQDREKETYSRSGSVHKGKPSEQVTDPIPGLKAAPSLESSYLGQFVPKELMAKLQAAKASGSMVNERRVVTMLFCDVFDSTAAAEKLDPEEWTEIINGGLASMIRSVYKYEGTVARLMGDAILAFFGAPLAHEDDPQRAVLAGLDIVASLEPYREQVASKWNIDFNTRIGINTGLVVVGTVGSDLRMEYTAMGDAINLASRMEQTAAPGTVQITEHTYKLVHSLFEFESLGEVTVKGKGEPVKAYRVLQLKPTPGRIRGLNERTTPLVGREHELNKLSAAMDQVQQGGGHIVTIIGEVGLGKSRLIEELYREWAIRLAEYSLRGDESPVPLSRWYNAFSLSYESSQPYGLFRHFLRQASGATIADPPKVFREKLRIFVDAILPADKRHQAMTVLESLFGLSQAGGSTIEGESFKRQLYDSMTSLVSFWARDAPGVIVCDDLHWADPASVDLLMYLFNLTDDRPLLLICALRPDRQVPGWSIRSKAEREFHHRYTEIQLEPLSREDSLKLVTQTLNNELLPEALVESVLNKAAGNPYFIEEVIRALIDEGSLIPQEGGSGWQVAPGFELKQLAIPDSLQSTLIARIDRLNESQRRILQLASVIGRSFYYRVLKEISAVFDQDGSSKNGALDRDLGDLQRMDYIAQTARIPELVYIFQQALVQESAYKTILRRQRRDYHRKVGEAIEALFLENIEEHAIVLAHHFSEASDDFRAFKYHVLAGDSAYRLYANAEAIEHYSQALTHGAKVDIGVEQLIHLYTNRGRALELTSHTAAAAQNYKEMQAKAQAFRLEEGKQEDSKKMELAALMPMATLYATPSTIYNLALVESLSDRALELAKELNDRAAEAKILWNLSSVQRYEDTILKAIEYGEAALAIARELNLEEQIAYSLNDIGHLYNRLGDYDKTKRALAEATDLWRRLGNLPMLTDSLSTATYVYTFTGSYEEAIAFSEEARQISESIHNIWGMSYSQGFVGTIYWDHGDPSRAIKTMEYSIRYAEEAGFLVGRIYTRATLGRVYAMLGDTARGLEYAQKADEISASILPQVRPNSLLHLARIFLGAGDIDAAEGKVQALRSLNSPIHLNQPDIITEVEGMIPFYRGRYKESIELLSERLSLLEKYGLRSFLPETHFLLGQALEADGRLDEAHKVLDEGLRQSQVINERWSGWQIMGALAKLSKGDQAEQLRLKALETLEFIISNISETELKATFLNTAKVRQVLEEQVAENSSS